MDSYSRTLEKVLLVILFIITPIFFIFSVYDLLTGQIVKKLANHKACVRDVSWHPCDNRLVSSSVSNDRCTV